MNRWKRQNVWVDQCGYDTQPLQGYQYLRFTNDKQVISDLELFGETYGCTGSTELIGIWSKENNKYYFLGTGEAVKYEITISGDGQTLCVIWGNGDDYCFEKE